MPFHCIFVLMGVLNFSDCMVTCVTIFCDHMTYAANFTRREIIIFVFSCYPHNFIANSIPMYLLLISYTKGYVDKLW
jgi:hypothetical protein